MKLFNLFLTFVVLCAVSSLHAEERGNEVVVLYNRRVSESKDIAEHYAKIRHVPTNQIFGFSMPTHETISRKEFSESLQKPLAQVLANNNLLQFSSKLSPATNGQPQHLQQCVSSAKIRYVVLCYGVPLHITENSSLKESNIESIQPELRRNEAAVDSELACIPFMDQNVLLTGPLGNSALGCTNSSLLNPTNGILMVTRLDGPTPAIARALVDKAVEAETNGLWGRTYFDLRGITNGDYKLGENYLGGAAEFCFRFALETDIDTAPATFPVAYPMSQIAFYAGWYDENVSGPFTRPTVEFMPGAFAYHLHSFSAATLRSKDRNWVGPLLAKGATASMGCVAEPFLTGTPNIAIFTARFFSGFTFGEAAYASQPFLSWQTTIVGDPLYRPFGRGARELHEDLEHRHHKLLEWSYLRLANIQLLKSVSLEKVAYGLENLALTKKSAVLQEKFADLCARQGKPFAAIEALQKALKLEPSPQQRVRLMQLLANLYISVGQNQDAYNTEQQFLRDCPDYPDKKAIEKQIEELSQKIGKKDNSPAATPPAKNPPARRGI